MSNEFLSPVGRLVQGDAFEPQTKDSQGAPLTVKTGPNAGQPTQKYFAGVAFAKNDPAWPAFHAQIMAVGRAAFPQFFDAAGNCTHPSFAWKIIDGDVGFDQNGRANNSKEGFAGHYVVRFTSSYPPKCFYAGRYQPHEQIQDKNAIRRGYYVRIAGTVEGNGNMQKPGVYMNLNMIELVAQGKEITSGPDAASVFGKAPAAALPPGAIPLPGQQPPFGSAPAVSPAVGYAGAAGATPLPPTGNVAAAGIAPPVAVSPNPAFTAPPPPAVPAVPAGPRMTAKANGATRESFIAQGWTDDLLRQHGYME